MKLLLLPLTAGALLCAPPPCGGEPPGRGRAVPLPPKEVELIAPGETPSPPRSESPRTAPEGVGAAGGERDPREIFSRGNILYEAGDYRGAAKEYETLAGLGYGGANLYYNWANSLLKLDRKGEAVLYYKKALALSPRDQDIKTNLEYAFSLREDRIEPPRESWIMRRWHAAVGYFTQGELAAAAAAAYWLLCATLIGAIYLRPLRAACLRGALVLLLALLLSLAASLSRSFFGNRREAVVLSSEAKVRYGPSDRDVTAFVLHEGAVVRIDSVKGDWFQVSLPDGKSGWIRTDACGVV